MAGKGKTTVSDLGPLDLQKLNQMLKEATVAQFKIHYFKESLSNIADRCLEELNVSKAEFMKYARVAFENHKAQEALEKAEELYENSVRLGLISESNPEADITRDSRQQAYEEMDKEGLMD